MPYFILILNRGAYLDKYIVASIYEILGEKEKAIAIYRQILLQDPSDSYSEYLLRRLVDKNNIEYIVNNDMLNCFININNNDNLIKLERWLSGN